MNPELVLALSNLSRIYGVMLGTLESLSTSHPDEGTRNVLTQLVNDVINQDVMREFVETLTGPTIIWKSGDAK